VILYRLLCGAMPYELDGSLFEIARIVCEEPPKPPRLHDPSIPADLEAIILRALAKEKDRRYQSAASFARDIERYLDGAPVEARSGSGWYLLRKAVLVNRHRLALAGGAAATLLGAGVAVAWSLGNAADSARQAEFDREQARAESVRARAVTELLREALPNAESGGTEIGWIYTTGLGRLYYRLETGAFSDDPDLDQMLRRMWGSVYTDFGSAKSLVLVEYAEVAIRSGLIELRERHGDTHPEIAATLHELAGVMLVRGRAAEAAKTCREALAMREELFGKKALKTADSRALLARALLALGKTDDAIEQAHEAMQVFQTLPDQESDLRIGAMSALEARVWISQSQATRAEAPLREALARRLRRLPPEDFDLLSTLSTAADFAQLAPDAALTRVLADAWECEPSRAAVAIREDLPRYRMLDYSDSCSQVTTGRTVALGRLLELQSALFGENDPALVRVLIAQMQAAGGEQLHEVKLSAALHAAEILSAARGELDRTVLACIEEAAVLLAYLGRAEEAVELTRRAQRIHELPPEQLWDVLIVSNSRRHLGWFLSLAGRHEEAIPEFQRAIDELTRELGPVHHVVALCEAGLAVALANTGNIAEAEALSAHAMTVARSSRIAAGDQLAHVCFARGRVLLESGRWSDARENLEEAWDRFYRCTTPGFRWRIETIEGIIRCLNELGEADAAARWRTVATMGLSEPPAASTEPAAGSGTP
jgi:tetratricopeptide (TPR) repeat protein